MSLNDTESYVKVREACSENCSLKIREVKRDFEGGGYALGDGLTDVLLDLCLEIITDGK